MRILRVYRRLDALQRARAFKLAATVAVLVLAGAVFGPLVSVSNDLRAQRVVLERELAGQSLPARDEHAVSLSETGSVTVGGHVYGGEQFRARAPLYFDEQGVLVAAGRLIDDLLERERPRWAPEFLVEAPRTTWTVAAVVTAWLLLVVWIELTAPFVLVTACTAAAMETCWLLGRESAMLAFAGMGLLTFTFVLLTRAVLILFSSRHQALAVAHTVVKEATRSRISLFFVVVLLVVLPLLPLWLDPQDPLRYRIQTFISRSLGVTYVLAAVMTLFLSAGTVAFEIRDRQIWQLVSKPLSRFNYLAGKWLGVASVNLVILLVAGVSIFAYTKHLSRLPVAPGLPGALDRLAVRDEVLTARVGAAPLYQELDAEQLRARVEQAIRRDPEKAVRAGEITRAEKNQMAREIQEAHLNAQRSIPPGEGRTYVFPGLGPARGLQSTLTLRYRFHILRDDEHARFPVAFVFGGLDEPFEREYIPTVTHVLPVGADLIRDDGTLEVTVVNAYRHPEGERGSGELNFEPGDLEVLYRAGSFEGNFLRAVLMTWVKLAFLAILGIACSTLLSFPVACLFSFTVFAAATLGPFLALSLREYYPPEPRDWGNAAQVIYFLGKSAIRLIAQCLVFMLHRFGEYRPTASLVEGRLIAWSTVAGGALWLGAVWSGICLAFGYLVLRRRELAIYSGHG